MTETLNTLQDTAYALKKGDQVRIVIEVTVKTSSPGTGYLVLEGKTDKRSLAASAFTLDPLGAFVESIEILKPPVVKFEAGQTVKEKLTGSTFLLTKEGFVDTRTWHMRLYSALNPKQYFTSEYFELVTE